MSIKKTIRKILSTKVGHILPDKAYIQLLYFYHFGRFADLNHPKTFNEKLQWLKLNDRKKEYSILVDKYAVKKYIADKIGEEYVIKTLGVWQKPEDINFDELPNQFVLKWNHDSGSIVICKDKNNFSQEEAIRKLKHGDKVNGFWYGREWPYKHVNPCIIAEEYMEDVETHELRDYKFFCFSGHPKVMFIASDRQVEGESTKFDFFDMDFNHLDIRNGHPNSTKEFVKPATFEKMKELAAVLSEGFPQIRVDFYEVNGRTYFGELTLYHGSGVLRFEPSMWDDKFGSWVQLPKR